jgi:pimeloyl-ACP methyl ester carboxylesterase
MARFIVLTGSETNSFAWVTFQRRLEAHGHLSSVFSLDDLPWQAGCDTAVDALTQKIGAASQAILIGHSIAGLMLPILGDRLEVASEIYVAAFTPKIGTSFLDRIFHGEEIFDPAWVDGYRDLIRSEDPQTTHRHFLDHHLFHDCCANAADLYWERSNLPFEVIYGCPHRSDFRPRNRHYVVCAADRTVRPEWQRRAASLLPDATVTEIESGHCPHLSKPGEIAEQILMNVSASNHQKAFLPLQCGPTAH